MIIYKFKTRFEENDDFLREIELRADQTFEDFHQAILGNLGLDPGMLASFYICDHRYRKLKEIQLVDKTTQESRGENPDSEEGPPENKNKTLLMHECVLKDYIDDPHQRLMFLYDPMNQWTFYIELVKINPADKSQSYPRFSKSVGPVPQELVATPKQVPGVEPPMDFVYDQEEEHPGDLSDYDQIEGADDFFDTDQGGNNDDFDPGK